MAVAAAVRTAISSGVIAESFSTDGAGLVGSASRTTGLASAAVMSFALITPTMRITSINTVTPASTIHSTDQSIPNSDEAALGAQIQTRAELIAECSRASSADECLACRVDRAKPRTASFGCAQDRSRP